MAESYRGLTIRIGADTTGLTKALREINSATKKAQSQLRDLAKAARIDPGNANVATQQIGAMARAAMDSAAKLQTLRRYQDEVGNGIPKGGTKSIKELADETENAALQAEETRKRYAGLEDELKRIYDGFNKVIESNGLDMSEFRFRDDNMPKVREFLGNTDYYEQVRKNLGLTEEEMAKLADRTERLKGEFEDTRKQLLVDKEVARFEDLNVQVAKTEADVRGVNDQLARLKTSDIAQGLNDTVNKFNLLDTASKVAEDRFKKLDEAFKLDPTNVELAEHRARALAEAQELARQKADNLRQQLAAYKSEGIDKLARGMRDVEKATEKATQQSIEANTAYDLSRQKVKLIEQAMQSLSNKGKENTDEYQELSRKLNEAESEMQQLKRAAEDADKVLTDTKKVSEYNKLQAELDETAVHAKTMGKNTKDALDQISAGAAIVSSAVSSKLSQMFSAMKDSSAEVDSAYRDLRKTLEAAEGEYEALRQAAIEFSETHVTSTSTMLEMEALGAQVGIAADELQRFAETASNLDVATDLEPEEIALQMGQLVNVMDDLEGDGVDRFADALVRLGNNMPAQESSIMNISQRLSSFGDIVGFTTPEVLGWSAAIASTGQKSEAAATAISNTIGKIEQVVAEGGEDLEAYAQVAGMSAEEFADAWNTKPSEALRDFIEGLGNLDESGESAIKILQDLELTGVRRQQALLGLSQTLGNLDDALLMSQHAWDGISDEWGAAGDAAREAERKSQGLSGALSIMSNNAQNLGAVMGEGLVPFVQLASGALAGLTNILKLMPDWLKSVTIAVGGGISILLAAAPAIKSYSDAYGQLAKGVRQWLIEQSGMNKVQAEFANAEAAATAAAEAQAAAADQAAAAQGREAAASQAAAESKAGEVAATEAKVAADGAETAASTANVAATEAETIASGANAAAKEGDAVASGLSAAAAGVDAGAQGADAAATGAAATAHTVASGAVAAHAGALAALFGAIAPGLIAVGALTAVVGGLFALWNAQKNSIPQEVQDLSDATDSFRDAARDSIAPTSRYVREVASLGEVTEAAMAGTEELAESMQNHADNIANLRDGYEETSVNLDHLAQVTDQYVGAGEASTSAMGELEWAAQQLSTQLGYAVTAEDLLKGTYEDEEGTVHNLREEIDDLIDARMREAQTNAYTGMYEESVKAKAEAAEQLAEAQDAYNQTVEHYTELYAAANDVSMDEARDWAIENADGIEQLKAAVDEAQEAFDLAAMSEENYAYIAGLMAKANTENAEGLDNFMAANENMMAIIDQNGHSLETFQQQLEEVGLTSDEMSQYSAEDIASLASAYDGSMESITAWIDAYNKQELDDKESNVNAKGNVPSGSAEEKIRNINDTVSRMADRTITVDANGNLVDGSALNVVSRLKTRLDQLQNGKWSISASINLPKRASGGIARHMAGGIATSATLTPHGLVGEAGAEYYDGDNIVPLTRTNVERYASGFTDVIADKVAARVGVGNVSNIQIGDLTVNNDEELEAAIRRVAVLVARRRDM